MNVNKVLHFEENLTMDISDDHIAKLIEKKVVEVIFFQDSKCSIDFTKFLFDTKFKLHIGCSSTDSDRVFIKFSLKLSNGRNFEFCSWGHSEIELLTVDEIFAWKKPRTFWLNIRIGIYGGSGGCKSEWQHIFTDPEDFIPLCTVQTPHSKEMDKIKSSKDFADVSLECIDGNSLSAHKCILVGSPYFNALFKFNRDVHIVEVEGDTRTMQVILSYLYSGRINENDVTNWQTLYNVASYYQLLDLCRHCELQMMARLTRSMDEIKSLLKFAIKFQAMKLKRYIVVYIRLLQKTQ